MSITNHEDFFTSIIDSKRVYFYLKGSITNPVGSTTGYASLWTVAGIPTAGDIPANTVAYPTSGTKGSIFFSTPSGGNSLYIFSIPQCRAQYAINGPTYIIADRLAHIGGLSGIITADQTVGLDASDSSLNTRRGASNYSELLWGIEWYENTGLTSVDVTVTYTNQNNVANRTFTAASIGGTARTGRFIPIIPMTGDFIKSVQKVNLSASTGTAGNFGITCYRGLTSVSSPHSSRASSNAVAKLGLPLVDPNACLSLLFFGNANTSLSVTELFIIFAET